MTGGLVAAFHGDIYRWKVTRIADVRELQRYYLKVQKRVETLECPDEERFAVDGIVRLRTARGPTNSEIEWEKPGTVRESDIYDVRSLLRVRVSITPCGKLDSSSPLATVEGHVNVSDVERTIRGVTGLRLDHNARYWDCKVYKEAGAAAIRAGEKSDNKKIGKAFHCLQANPPLSSGTTQRMFFYVVGMHLRTECGTPYRRRCRLHSVEVDAQKGPPEPDEPSTPFTSTEDQPVPQRPRAMQRCTLILVSGNQTQFH
ncbi:hypothetical protein J6590_094863 [Homalodisca vitripennis]|nr:hypothetical protein J6590_094863 [Homalodisca vitripennis]